MQGRCFLTRFASAGGTGTFDFLGLTHYGAKARQGYGVSKRKTIGKRLRRFMQASWTWCRDNRHAPFSEQYRTLCAKLRGSNTTAQETSGYARPAMVMRWIRHAIMR
jgi:hypothetical protein